jgi:DNA polymerase-3 subunit delta
MDLFSPFQVSWIRDVDLSNASTAGDLGKIVGKFSSAHKLLLSAKELNAKHPLRAQVAAQGFVVDLESLKNYELRRWLEKELRRLGISPRDEEALVSLLSAGEESPDRLASMSEQLACFCSEATFSVSDVAQLFVFHAIPGEFEFLDSLVAGNTKRCELMLTELLLTGKSAFMLLALISRSFSNYLAVRLLLDERASPQDIRQKLGLSPWVYNKAVAAGQRYSAGQLVEVMQTLVRIDSRLKNRSLGPDALLSELVLNLGASQKASKSRRPAWPSPLPI